MAHVLASGMESADYISGLCVSLLPALLGGTVTTVGGQWGDLPLPRCMMWMTILGEYPLYNPPASAQSNSWSSNADIAWIAHNIFRSPQVGTQLFWVIISDNSGNNADISRVITSHPSFSPIQWTSGLRCAAHLWNLKSQTNIFPEDPTAQVPAK
ncbi:hypothetical protein B0H10DRAFT_1937728 [Mycena sp. CBHHK59/15]|nr:hypothetical protein B0H10DRAFT_1937728 [Mycena sp. CBHHK59/15]